MEDLKIIELYSARKEEAIKECEIKYGKSLRSLSYRITGSKEDADECVNDAFLTAWQSVPSVVPDKLYAYLVSIVRNLSLDRYRRNCAKKRGAVQIALDELIECIPDEGSLSQSIGVNELTDEIKRWLGTLDREKQAVFIRRYFMMETVRDISKSLGIKEKTLSGTLARLRASLKTYLEENGYTI